MRQGSKNSNNAEFVLVDPNENVITDDSEGLLLFEGGTVCDDGWTDTTANLICRKMGHHAATSWRNGSFVYQSVCIVCVLPYLSVCLFVCLSVCLSCLSECFSVSLSAY